MWIYFLIAAVILILYFIYKWNEQEKEIKLAKAQKEEQDANRQSYNSKCIIVKINYREGKISVDDAWKQLEEIGDKFNIPEDERTTSLQGSWSGAYNDGRRWTVKDEPGWEQNIPKEK